MDELYRAHLQEAIDLIESKLVRTTSFYGKPLDALTDYDRGVQLALREAQAVIRYRMLGGK